MDARTAQRWLDDYVAAWRSNDANRIAALFSQDCEYRYHPYDDPVVGRESLVSSWLEEPDDPESWEAGYRAYAVDGDRVVAVGESRYRAQGGEPERLYHNAFLLEFDEDGRCRRFTEYYVKEP